MIPNLYPLWPLRVAVWDTLSNDEYAQEIPLLRDNAVKEIPFARIENTALVDEDTDTSNISKVQISIRVGAYAHEGGGETVNKWISYISHALSNNIDIVSSEGNYSQALHSGPGSAYISDSYDEKGQVIIEGVVVVKFIISQV